MSDALELALVLLACTTPILAIMWMNHYIKQLKRRSKLQEEQAGATAQANLRELDELRQRIEVLESIITDRGYRLDQELRTVAARARS